MAVDNNLNFTGGVATISATAQTSAKNLQSRTSIRRQTWLRIRYYNAQNASGANTLTFSAQTLGPDGSTYYDQSVAPPIALTTTAKRGVVCIDLVGMGPTIRVQASITGSGTSPQVSYEAAVSSGLDG